jgi:hypothetical protein
MYHYQASKSVQRLSLPLQVVFTGETLYLNCRQVYSSQRKNKCYAANQKQDHSNRPKIIIQNLPPSLLLAQSDTYSQSLCV